jgi:hypothetical protein
MDSIPPSRVRGLCIVWHHKKLATYFHMWGKEALEITYFWFFLRTFEKLL